LGIERTELKVIFAIDVVKRDYETIKSIFEKFFHRSSIIHTDGWKAYEKVCEELRFEYKIVNLSKWF
jgi:hypothetical protein